MTKEEFIEKARNIHGYKYQYPTLTDKILSEQDIDILYKDVLYKQKVNKHINLGRCPEKNTPTKTTEKFIEESKKIWGDKYDYSLVKYVNAFTKVKILFEGVTFYQVPVSHTSGLAPELKYNLEFFLKKAKEKHGDKYDYSLVEYKSQKSMVKILYNNTVYLQTPENHLLHSPENKILIKTTKEFIQQCSLIHNNKYDYSKTIYTLSKNKLIITCKIHGDFEQVANSHYSGMGCIQCGYESINHKKVTKTTEEFIIEAKKIWGDKYDYSLTNYINVRNKIKIIHDGIIYEQSPNLHLKYPVESYLDQNVFLQKAKNKWGDKYDYSLIDFKTCKFKIKIIHNGIIYEQYPYNHLIYAPELRNTKTQEEFIKESLKHHSNKYKYNMVEYINSTTKVKIICDKHGIFLQTPNSHKRSGCPHCNESKGEKTIAKVLNKYKISFERQKRFIDCRNVYELPFDFYIPSMRISIEYDGIQHFEPVEYFGGDKAYNQTKINDKIKNDYCEDNFINLIRIKYTDIDNIENILKNSLEIYKRY